MKKHKVFVLDLGMGHDEVIAFVPTLREAYLVSKENEAEIPGFVELENNQAKDQPKHSSLKFDRTTIVITQCCNLGCVYCYESATASSVSGSSTKVMPWEVIKATMDYVFSSALKKVRIFNDNFCLINFFGGEPTVAWRELQRAIKYARQKSDKIGLNLRITLSTNGFFTKKKLDWLLEVVDAFNLSIDGPKEIHNVLRPTVSGTSSFDVVFKTAQAIYSANPEKLLLRTTISRESVLEMSKIARFFSENFPGVIQAYEPLQETGRALQSGIEGPSLKSFLDQALNIFPIVEANGGSVKLSVLDLGNLVDAFCGVNGFNFIVTPEGLVTSCNRKMARSELLSEMFIFGEYDFQKREFVFDREVFNKLKSYSTGTISECRKCVARYACRGGCPAIKADSEKEFWRIPSSYCQEIKQFMAKILLYKLQKSSETI